MTTIIEAKLKKWDRQTNVERYKVAAHKVLQNIFSVQTSYILSQHKAEKYNTF